MEVKIKGGSIFKVTAQENSKQVEYTEKNQIEQLVANTNCNKNYVTEGGSQLLSKEHISALGLHGEGKDV